jgi:hypothetical protein
MGESFFIEQQILNAVRGLLAGRVNELLGEGNLYIPPVEFGEYRDGSAVVPLIGLSTWERTEKERIIRLDAYSLTVTFTLPEMTDSELFCYAYAAALERALGENKTLDGVADRAVLTGKKYKPPKKPHCGEGWEVTLSLRVTAENDQLAMRNEQ